MGSSPRSALTPIQTELLEALFAREDGFFLSGGAALAGYHLGHRATDDLDLFTPDREAFERGRFALRDAAASIGAGLEVRQEAPGFLRLVASRGEEAVVVDLVLDPVPQRVAEKPIVGGIRVDPPEEIVANKLAALAGRAETRDLVDLLFLERAGYGIEEALDAALAKDGGATPAAISWALSELHLPEGVTLPAGVPASELRAFRDALVRRLRSSAYPGRPPEPR